MKLLCVGITRSQGIQGGFEILPPDQERIKGTEKASPIHTLFHR